MTLTFPPQGDGAMDVAGSVSRAPLPGEAVPCSAFSRSGAGGWKVLAPVMLNLDGRLYSPTVGTTFAAGSMQHGIEMSDVLDRNCGNR